jgi:bifunctional lysine-specific demethylase and histidyl-hydroxylase NO66
VTDPDVERLRELVGDVDAFARDHWGRRPLHRRTGTDRSALLDLSAVERLLSGSLRQPAFRLVRDGRPLPPRRSTRPVRLGGRWLSDVADLEAVAAAVADGSTLVLQSLHRTWPPLQELCRALERATSHPCQTNAYLTPAGATGLGRHHDEHDVLVLQLEGVKRWAVDGLGELQLSPGDVLYLPARTPHRAVTQDGPSLHLTVGILPVTYRSVLRRTLAELDGRGDEPLPMGYARPEQAGRLEAGVADALAAAARGLEQATAHDVARRERARAQRRVDRPPPGRLASVLALERLSAASLVQSHLRSDALHDGRTDGRVALELARQRLLLPVAMAPALRRLLSGGTVAVSALPGLTPASQLVLARRLVREGAATIVEGAAGAER